MPDNTSSNQSELEQLKYELKVRDAADRVLDRALTMRHTSELQDVINEVGTQLRSLDMDITGGTFISINDEVGPDLYVWGYGGTADYVRRVCVPFIDQPIFTGLVNRIKGMETGLYTEAYSREEKIAFFKHLFSHAPYNQTSPEHQAEVLSREGGYVRSCYLSEYTSLFIINHHGRKFSDRDHEVLIRFGEIFEKSYRRFLDLQKAEQQAREAQIEAALERVRASAMGMRSSDELSDVLSVMFNQFDALGIQPVYGCLDLFNLENNTFTHVITGRAGHRHPVQQVISLEAIDIWKESVESWQNGDPETVQLLHYPPERMGEVWDVFDELFDSLPKEARFDRSDFPNGIFSVAGYHKHGYIGFMHHRKSTKEEVRIVSRFSKEFDRLYQRFLDLQKAEQQAREAQVEAALERVRARTMAMQKSSELSETAATIFNQIEKLGLRPWSCGFNIWDHEHKKITQWVSSGDGRILPSFQSPSDEDLFLRIAEAAKKADSLYIEEMGGEDLESHYAFMRKLPGLEEMISDLDEAGISLPTFQVNHAAFFSHGYLMFITYEPAPEFHEIFTRFATVFDQTYTRFLDLKQAEEQELLIRREKERLEKTLAELRATQAQLIHAEKMASLGELTAGIAHEIKNPLNFINNFSDVSTELLDEVVEELNKGDHEEALLIIEDLKTNLQRIVGHGRRADSIVNGMLMHSRGDSQGREMTDLNALCDEYLRLAYHGLRARDKSFNADMETDFDDAMPHANVAPQQIGRVLLNLITNAFHAVSEKSSEAGPGGFHPLVTVKTARHEGAIRITVSDNGNGIPDNIVDKIFQPFFTTKPTGSGTGLGLSISYDIVKAHGGTISVHSRAGEGTDFVVSLPISGE